MNVDVANADAAPRRRTLALTGGGLVVLASLLGLWILLRGNDPFVVDTLWDGWLLSWESRVATSFALTMSWLGGGWFGVLAVPLGVATFLVIVRRPWSAAYFLVAEAFSAALVQLLKHVFARERPEDILIVADFGSFPSGHTANAATLAVALFMLFPRRWVAILGAVWVVLMALSRTIVHAHWLSDTLGGALLGAGAALVVTALMRALIDRERGRPLRPGRAPHDPGAGAGDSHG